jgi:hypothetical protein
MKSFAPTCRQSVSRRLIKPAGLPETKTQHASKIEETADGGRSRFGSKTRETVKVVPARRFQTDGEVDEQRAAQGIRRHEAQGFAEEKVEEKIEQETSGSRFPKAMWPGFHRDPDELPTRSESAFHQ